jgi:hypothetical protein
VANKTHPIRKNRITVHPQNLQGTNITVSKTFQSPRKLSCTCQSGGTMVPRYSHTHGGEIHECMNCHRKVKTSHSD